MANVLVVFVFVVTGIVSVVAGTSTVTVIVKLELRPVGSVRVILILAGVSVALNVLTESRRFWVT